MLSAIAVKAVLILGIFAVFGATQRFETRDPDPRCEANQQYYDCKPCNATCSGIMPCEEKCTPGCYCKYGYVLEHESSATCMPQSECPCMPNAQFSECEYKCQPTCDDYMQTDRMCVTVCHPGCVCTKGYVMHNEQCIKPIRCPKNTQSKS